MTPLDEVREDLQAEQEALGSVLVRLTDEAWERDTHAPGWKVRDQVAHLAAFDEAATRAIVDPAAFRAEVARRRDEPEDLEGDYIEKGRRMTPRQLLEWWQAASRGLIEAAKTLEPKARMPWYGPDMSGVSFLTARLMETWSHGLDVIDVVGLPRPATDRIRHVVFLGARTRSFSYINRGLVPNEEDVYLDLVLPSGSRWTSGDPASANRITGSAEDFAQVVTQRRHAADTDLVAVGEAAREWLTVAQAFAGPPGQGRQPGEFPRS
jgi:uncharacterized protein (TIGR03084 family)